MSDAEHNPSEGEPPFVLCAEAAKVDWDTAVELRSTLAAHKGDTPVHLVLRGSGEITLALPDYPVKVSAELSGELKGIRGITIAT